VIRISLRAKTNTSQHIPDTVPMNKISKPFMPIFGELVNYSQEDIPNQPIGRFHIGNIDQTPIPFDWLAGKTYTTKGGKTKSSGGWA